MWSQCRSSLRCCPPPRLPESTQSVLAQNPQFEQTRRRQATLSEERGVRERKEKLATLASVKTGETRTRACGDQCFSRVLTIDCCSAMHVAFVARCMETVLRAPPQERKKKSNALTRLGRRATKGRGARGMERVAWGGTLAQEYASVQPTHNSFRTRIVDTFGLTAPPHPPS
jgi:hypothetical protein